MESPKETASGDNSEDDTLENKPPTIDVNFDTL
jgi:hypothetical protein